MVRIDHVVLWVEDPVRSVAFYEDVLGFAPVRLEEHKAGKAPFPSVRIGDHALLDLVPMRMAALLNASVPFAAGTAGHKLNHVCVSMSRAEFQALRERLAARGVDIPRTMTNSFGAEGQAPDAFYFADPDGNILEARTYEP